MSKITKKLLILMLFTALNVGLLPLSGINVRAEDTQILQQSASETSISKATLKSVGTDNGINVVKWNAVNGAAGYEIYRKSLKSAAWEKYVDITDGSVVRFEDKEVVADTRYYYTVKAYVYDSYGNKVYADYDTEGLGVITSVGTVKLTGISTANGGNTVNWNSIAGVQGYVVKRKSSDGSKWITVAVLKGADRNTYTDAKAVYAGADCTYTVFAMGKKQNGERNYGGFDKTGLTIKASVKTVVLKSVYAVPGRNVVTWNKVKGADGYIVMRKPAAEESWTVIKTVKGENTVRYDDTEFLRAGVEYLYTVKAYYLNENGKKVYGANSDGKSVIVKNVSTSKVGILTSFNIEMSETYSTDYRSTSIYFADTPNVISFFDYNNYYNVVYCDYYGDNNIIIQRYNDNMALVDTVKIEKRYELFGNAICDEQGNYYIAWGNNDNNAENIVTMCISKYDYNGNSVGELALNGYDTGSYGSGSYWGTKYPFDAGNCSLVVNEGVLACHYAREMYSGHQSNYVIYLNCADMSRINVSPPYESHSFDQRIITTSDGGYLAVSHGDYYSRAFTLFKIGSDCEVEAEKSCFHFREGANRDHGYNETYAQLGGIAETDNAYVLCASSERTLSLDTAPTNKSYLGHSEARDLFIQILKKDRIYNSLSADSFLGNGVTRAAEGSAPNDALTDLALRGDEVDYGVIWLTDYSDEYYVNNPKIIATNDSKIVIMWEKRPYSYVWYEGENVETYYMILNENGTVLRAATKLDGVKLAGNIDPIYRRNKIYWTTYDGDGARINCLDLGCY